MITETQGLPLWDVFLAGDRALPTGRKKDLNDTNKQTFYFNILLA